MTKIDGIEHARKLWILEQVISTGSFRAAASKAKVSSPAISQAITNLERLVGKPLLIRKDGKIFPTEIADQILTASKPAIQALRELSIRAESSDLPNIAWISFGAYESLAVELLPKFTAQVQAKLPKCKLTVRIANNSALATMVRNGELCAAVVEENDNLGRLTSVPLCEDRLGCFVSAKMPKDQRNWECLAEGSVGTISPGADGYSRYYSKFTQAAFGKNFRPSLVSDSYEVLRSSAVYGSIMAILPARVAHRYQDELVEIDVPGLDEKSRGQHQIVLISQPNCDQAEIEFLASEIIPLLKK